MYMNCPEELCCCSSPHGETLNPGESEKMCYLAVKCILYNVNMKVIYFLLCCTYGNFLINMEWSFFFYQRCWIVFHCILFIIVGLFVFLFLREQGFYLKRSTDGGGFSMDCFTMFAVYASYCGFTSLLARVTSVAQQHPERHDQATQQILKAYVWIEAHYFFWVHSTPPSAPTKPWSLRGTNSLQFWL